MTTQFHPPRLILLRFFVATACLTILVMNCSAQSIVDTWQYSLNKPADGWRETKFDDSDWTEGAGGFGTSDTPGARVGTTWATNSIWLRKSFTLQTVLANPVLWRVTTG